MQYAPAMERDATDRIELFEYPAHPNAVPQPAWKGWTDSQDPNEADPPENPEAALRAEFERRLHEEVRRAFEAGREQGSREERNAQAASLATLHEQQKRQLAALVENFAREGERYLHAVEHEVVRLALAVAARILRREAQMDPLLLTGAVRVALGQISASTEVRLCVPRAELALWTEAIALLTSLPVKPEVVTGDGLRTGDCILETKLGTVDLGLRAQLCEIERGFFDRVSRVADMTLRQDCA